VEFLLADSIAKKLKVVEAVAEALELRNVKTRHTRAEDIRDRKFDFVVSRAVAPLKDLWRWSKPLLHNRPKDPDAPFKQGLICLKGGDLASEIQESGTRPRVMDIHELFAEDYFRGKFLLYIPR
jgi:16S rRNA (guanine527-N7)-methyltransferase